MADLPPAGHAAAPPRIDAPAKVTGTARYTADVRLPGMLHAKVLRSRHAHARLISVDASRARAVPGVHAVLTRDELGGVAPGYGYFVKDQPVVARDKVRYVGDVIAAVAAVDEATALRALELIDVAYEPLPAVPDIDAALADGAPSPVRGSAARDRPAVRDRRVRPRCARGRTSVTSSATRPARTTSGPSATTSSPTASPSPG